MSSVYRVIGDWGLPVYRAPRPTRRRICSCQGVRGEAACRERCKVHSTFWSSPGWILKGNNVFMALVAGWKSSGSYETRRPSANGSKLPCLSCGTRWSYRPLQRHCSIAAGFSCCMCVACCMYFARCCTLHVVWIVHVTRCMYVHVASTLHVACMSVAYLADRGP